MIGSQRSRQPRWWLSCLLAVVCALSAFAAHPSSSVLAGEDWCEGDPLIFLDGQRVQILVQVPVASLPYVSPANPVVIKLYVPQDVHVAPIQYSGPIAERVDIVRTDDRAEGRQLKIRFAVFAPDPPGRTNDFPVRYVASSAIDVQTGATRSGHWHHDAIEVPRR